MSLSGEKLETAGRWKIFCSCRIFVLTALLAIFNHRAHEKLLHSLGGLTPRITLRSTSRTAGALFCAAALLLSSGWCLAQTPSPTPPPCPDNGEVTVGDGSELILATKYQPYPSPSPLLKCYRFAPANAAPDAKLPTVIMVPPDIFHDDMVIDGGEPHERQASSDLLNAGFLVFQVETRLAPPGKLPGQLFLADPGYAPEQTDDLKRQILSALDDRQCNGNIYLVGGSAGGCLALWVSLDPASTVSGWDEHARAHIKAVVSLSGPTNFCDWPQDDHDIPPGKVTEFENVLDDYVGLPDQTQCKDDTAGLLEHASPYWLVTNGATSNPPPIMLYTTVGDHVPPSQAADMFTALQSQFPGLDVEEWEMKYTYGSGYEHAFHYWRQINDATGSDGECVSEEVIDFLQSH